MKGKVENPTGNFSRSWGGEIDGRRVRERCSVRTAAATVDAGRGFMKLDDWTARISIRRRSHIGLTILQATPAIAYLKGGQQIDRHTSAKIKTR